MVALPGQLRDLPLQAGDPAFQFLNPIAQWRDFLIDEMLGPIAHTLVDLCCLLFQRFPCQPIVQHAWNSSTYVLTNVVLRRTLPRLPHHPCARYRFSMLPPNCVTVRNRLGSWP